MLKAIQILGSSASSSSSSSGLVSSFSQGLKFKKKATPHPNCFCGFSSISRKSIATDTISLSSRKSTLPPFLIQVHKYNQKSHFCNFRASGMSLDHDESVPDGPSSSASSSVTVHSLAVSFLFF